MVILYLYKEFVCNCISQNKTYFLAPNYHVLIKLLEKVADWEAVAAHLLKDEDGSKIKAIGKSKFHDVEDCRAEMIHLYLKSGDVSWENVLSALRMSNYTNLADEIEKKV